MTTSLPEEFVLDVARLLVNTDRDPCYVALDLGYYLDTYQDRELAEALQLHVRRRPSDGKWYCPSDRRRSIEELEDRLYSIADEINDLEEEIQDLESTQRSLERKLNDALKEHRDDYGAKCVTRSFFGVL